MAGESGSALTEVMKLGQRIAGGSVGVAVGLATSNPYAGLAANATSTRTLERLGEHFRGKRLAPREEVRVGATMTYGYIALSRALEAGRELRSDSHFFREDHTGRSQAEEVLESILLAAEREYEERKLAHYGAMLAEVAISSTVTVERALMLIRIATRLSYQQIVVLAASLDGVLGEPGVSGSVDALACRATIEELKAPARLLQPDGRGRWELTSLGAQLGSMLHVEQVPRQEIDNLRNQLGLD